MLKVHHLGISQSERIVWLCEELGLPYELVRYERDPVTRMAPPAYKALDPIGTAPVIEDGPLRLGESAAIVEYILRRHAGGKLLLNENDPEFAEFLYWFHFANGSLMPAIMMEIVPLMMGVTPKAPAPGSPPSRTAKALAAIEDRLGGVEFYAGSSFTAADIMMLFPLTTMRYFVPRDLTPFPNIRAYLQRIGERPAYQAAMAKGDPGLPLQLV